MRAARHRLTSGLGVALALLVLAATPAARAQEIVADLSDHLIAITTGFTGTDVVLFGAIDEPGDVIVVVRGPAEPTTVRWKDRVAGIWINTASATFTGVPGYYAVAANRPIEEITTDAVLARHGLGLSHIPMRVSGEVPRLPDVEGGWLDERASLDLFRSALIRNRQDEQLFSTDTQTVSFLGEALFRAEVRFPANVPTGQYTVSAYLFRDGDIITAQTTPLIVSKIGFGAAVFDFATRQPVVYGILAIIVAVTAGWLASAVFRSGR
jgi:uncharacterized protein (TIGR02186 family)